MQFFLLMLLILSVDQISKYIAVDRLSDASVTIINGVFDLTYVQNTGGAFGLLRDEKWFFLIGIPIILIAVSVYMLKNARKSTMVAVSTALIMGGAVGNYIDRLRLGYVIDFLDFKVWPVFNFADTSIVIGTLLLGFYLLFSNERTNNCAEEKGSE